MTQLAAAILAQPSLGHAFAVRKSDGQAVDFGAVLLPRALARAAKWWCSYEYRGVHVMASSNGGRTWKRI